MPWMGADIGVIVALGDGRIEYANPLAERVLGDATLTGANVYNLVWLLGEEYQRLAQRLIARLGSQQAQPVRNVMVDVEQASGRRRIRIDVLANGAVDGQPRWLLLLLDLGPVAKPPASYASCRPWAFTWSRLLVSPSGVRGAAGGGLARALKPVGQGALSRA